VVGGGADPRRLHRLCGHTTSQPSSIEEEGFEGSSCAEPHRSAFVKAPRERQSLMLITAPLSSTGSGAS
jgi:hypothetical protein